ncbi:hypothetical protein PHYSODRAFT_520017 [Phytophthora sojae]|uniref:Protein kinase domain-containing protein n=1 Tax=Phytophthora sojae (strain P6497) TaxID=1094619 RepID=G4ZZK6_PHYSP|nr:hypothetical protein PHYSODRAFT_520017 [Phytophthora sojae]EGZ11206.1 hypothetical protein PHYSODRAFT_520017 [Phytophthora sojae]|eukprot:XP_009533951.1 hypothetical protein PHYSODRAFT_520017 [Phytophthora sojae]
MRASALVSITILAAGSTSTSAQDYTITFRSVEEAFPSPSPTNDSSFVFDGTNSDIAQQLYIRHQAGDVEAALELNFIPAFVAKRLDPLFISFKDLPGLVQRALLWDSGFAISPDNDPVQIWTMENYTMANISVPQQDIAEVNCTMLECPQPNSEPAYSSQYCTGSQILNVSRCVADTFEDSGASGYLGVMWSTGGSANMTPLIRLRDHSWVEPTTGDAYELYAIHTESSADDPTWNQCPANGGYSSLVVPCHKRSEFTDKDIAAMTKPAGSNWVTNWLREEFAVKKPRFNKLLLIPIILGSLVTVAAGAFVGVYLKRRAKRRNGEVPDDYEAFQHHYVAGESYDAVTSPVMSTDPSYAFSSSSRAENYESVGSNQTFRILLHSPHLHGNRIPYDNLVFESKLSRGGSGVVWLCKYGGQQVAAKKLLLTRGVKADDVQSFAEEIELTASLVHPYIVKFIGVAWNNLTNLSMVIEYVPNGNLRDYLEKNIRILSWARDKIHIAIAIAEALEYLHSRTPGVIHRDLKFNNILLTKHLEPKLTDFGVSRNMIDSTMTSGVGTPYWTAPEILEGDRYTEKSDIYSFGVVLSELDTGRIPYSDAVMEDGSKVRPFHILQEVMAGAMRPNFSRDCPPRIQRIGAACLSLDPRKRPTARELVLELLGKY